MLKAIFIQPIAKGEVITVSICVCVYVYEKNGRNQTIVAKITFFSAFRLPWLRYYS